MALPRVGGLRNCRALAMQSGMLRGAASTRRGRKNFGRKNFGRDPLAPEKIPASVSF